MSSPLLVPSTQFSRVLNDSRTGFLCPILVSKFFASTVPCSFLCSQRSIFLLARALYCECLFLFYWVAKISNLCSCSRLALTSVSFCFNCSIAELSLNFLRVRQSVIILLTNSVFLRGRECPILLDFVATAGQFFSMLELRA